MRNYAKNHNVFADTSRRQKAKCAGGWGNKVNKTSLSILGSVRKVGADRLKYRQRNIIERMFAWLKESRRIGGQQSLDAGAGSHLGKDRCACDIHGRSDWDWSRRLHRRQ